MATDTETFATKADLASAMTELRAEMAELRGDLRTEMAELRGGLRTEMAELGGGLRAHLESELRAQTWRLSGLTIVTLGIGITLARLA